MCDNVNDCGQEDHSDELVANCRGSDSMPGVGTWTVVDLNRYACASY